MTKLETRVALDITKLNFGGLLEGKHAYANKTTIRVDFPKTHERVRFEGAFSASGKTVNGTAHTWQVTTKKTGHLRYAFTEAKLSASEVLAAAKTKSKSDDRKIIEKMLAGNDSLAGSAFDDVLYGYGGNDLLQGGSGKDRLDGGTGDHDLVNYANSSKSVQITLDRANWVGAKFDGVAQDRVRNIEDVAGGKGKDTLTGDKLANHLWGNDGNDTLTGAAGNDTLEGGNGHDSLLGGSGNDSLLGGAGNDLINGGSGNDLLNGGNGNDILSAGGGNDLVIGGKGHDSALGGAGNDTMDGGKGNDTLYGNSGADSLLGGKGNDVLAGGAGKDTETGGSGADIFRFVAVTDSTTTAAGRDFITDFTHKLDKIDLSMIDAVTSLVPLLDDAFTFDKKMGKANSAVAEGHIGWYQLDNSGTAADRTFIVINNDGDATAEMTIELQGLVKLGAVDFIL